MVDRLRKIVFEISPDASEKANMGWRSISFQDPKMGYFCGIFPFEDRVELIFEFGVLLPDPEGILQGNARQVRYLSFHEPREIRIGITENFLKAALDLPPQHSFRRGLTQSL